MDATTRAVEGRKGILMGIGETLLLLVVGMTFYGIGVISSDLNKIRKILEKILEKLTEKE